MTLDDMVDTLDTIIPQLEQIRMALQGKIENHERGDPWFEAWNTFGGSVGLIEKDRRRLNGMRNGN